MEEKRDIYEKNGNKTKKVIKKHDKLLPGEYVLHTIIILKLKNGNYVMQQRSLNSKYYPGKWDVTGGAVLSGETSYKATIREVYEELGIKIDNYNITLIGKEIVERENNTGEILDIYGCVINLSEKDFKINNFEVNDLKFVSYNEFINNVLYNKSEYFKKILKKFENDNLCIK